MKNQLNDKQKLLLYKYGSQAFFMLLIEIGIVACLFGVMENFEGVYNLLHDIRTSELLMTLVLIPFGYYALRGLLSNCIKHKGAFYLAPVYTFVTLISSTKVMLFSIIFLTIIWVLFTISVYQLIRGRRQYAN